MHKDLIKLLEIAIVGGGLALAVGACGDDGEDSDGDTDVEDTAAPTSGCPTTTDTGAAEE